MSLTPPEAGGSSFGVKIRVKKVKELPTGAGGVKYITTGDHPKMSACYSVFLHIVLCYNTKTEGLCKRTDHLDIFFRPSLNGVLFPMFCLLLEGKCQILVF